MYNESQKRATAKYMKAHLDNIQLRVKKGERERYKEAAEKLGLSLNQMFIKAVEEYLINNGLA